MSNEQPPPSLNSAKVVAVGICAGTVVYPVIGTLLIKIGVLPVGGPGMQDESAHMLEYLLLAAGACAAAGSFALRRVLDSSVPRGPEAFARKFRNMLVGIAMAEGAGVFGLIIAIMTGALPYALTLWGISIAACVLHFPTKSMTE
ncbi:MAG: hypothetical protein AMXMBFR4_05380 [Candidatus Hydrogenedentota bacterium]